MKFVSVLWATIAIAACTNQVKRGTPFEKVRSVSEGNSCFSPDEACDEKLIEFIRSAQQSLDIAVFDITHPQIVHEILVSARRIPVRILVDKRQSREPHSLVSTLIRAGAHVRVGHQRGIMHHKFILLDHRAVETGSFNFTNSASFKNQENQVYLNDPSLVERFRKRFEKMWNDGRDL
jgi:hypothetical protein